MLQRHSLQAVRHVVPTVVLRAGETDALQHVVAVVKADAAELAKTQLREAKSMLNLSHINM